MSIGDVSGKMIMRTAGWERGLSSATMSLRTHGRQAKSILFESRSATEKYSMKMAEASAMAKKFGWDQKALAFQTARLKEQFLGVVPAATRASRAMASMRTSVTGMATGYLGPVALVGAGAMAARRAEGIRQDMRSSLAIMGEVSDEMKAVMRETASVVAAETKFSTAEASKAYYFLASAGMDAAQSIAALPTVSKFAQAGMFDLSRATDLLTDAQMALGMSSTIVSQNMENMTRVGDVLVGANTIANASVEQFSEALTNKAAAALRMVNKDIEEGVAWLAVYANQGVKGADAGTALSIVLRDLQTKAIKNAAAFAELGIAVYNTKGGMNNLADIIGDMERAMEGMTAQGKKAMLMQLGLSDKSVAYTQVLIGMSAAGRDFEEQLDSITGKMDEVSGKQLTDFAKGWERVKSVWDKMATGPIGGFLDQLGQVMQLATGDIKGAMAGDQPRRPAQSIAESMKQATERFPMGEAVMGWTRGAAGWAGETFTAAADRKVVAEQQRGEALDKAMGVARQANLDLAKRQQEFEVRLGLGWAAMKERGGGWVSGARAQMGGLGIGGQLGRWGLGEMATGWAVRQRLAQEQRTHAAAAAKKMEQLRKPIITRAMQLLQAAGTDGAALRFASADVYGSQAAASAIARAQAPGVGKRTQEDLLTDIRNLMVKEDRRNAELLPLARRIVELMPVEADTPP